jgi:GNAT superfamily N-acetyltransferase
MTAAQTTPSLYSSTELHVRLAYPEDTARIGELLVAGFPSYAYPETTEDERSEAERRNATKENLVAFANTSLRDRKGNAEHWTEYIHDVGQLALVAELDQVGIVGYAASKEWQEPYYGVRLAELHDIQVAENFRMRGIGRRLLEQIGEWHYQNQNSGTFANFVSWAPCGGFYRHMGAIDLGPFNSSKTVPASQQAIQFDITAAILLHDRRLAATADVDTALLYDAVRSYVGA